MINMEWTKENVLEFIKMIEEQPTLWDSTDPNNKVLNKKIEVWETINQKFNRPASELSKKWHSLKETYRTERCKQLRYSLKKQEVLPSPWFAYDAMKFLTFVTNQQKLAHSSKDRGTTYGTASWRCDQRNAQCCKGRVRTDGVGVEVLTQHTCALYQAQVEERKRDISHEESSDDETEIEMIKIENNYDSEEKEISCSISPIPLEWRVESDIKSEPVSPPRIPPVTSNSELTQKTTNVSRQNEPQVEKNNSARRGRHRDEFFIYGEYLATKLRKLDKHSSTVTQHFINKVLFEAELGRYKDSFHLDND